jgi:hypothetical protein
MHCHTKGTKTGAKTGTKTETKRAKKGSASFKVR